MDRRAVELAFVHVRYCGVGGGGRVVEEVAETTIGVDWRAGGGIGLVGRKATDGCEGRTYIGGSKACRRL